MIRDSFSKVAVASFFLFSGISFVNSLTEVTTNVPAIALDYKIHVDAGREDCYYQYIRTGSAVYVQFQVIKGGDGQAGFAVKDPHGQFVLPYAWKSEATYDTQTAIEGYYALCIDNQFSKFSAKLVSVYLNAYVVDDWSRFHDELEKLELSVGNFTQSITSVDSNMASVLQSLHHSRTRESRDYALLLDNNYYISFWSIVQCLIIIGTGGFHVYFIRNLFNQPATGKTKVRL